MKLGAAGTIKESEDLRKVRGTIADYAFPAGGTGGSGGGPEGGGDMPNLSGSDHPDAPATDKSKYIAWFLLLAVGMTFAGLLGAYLMIATNRAAEWKPFDLPVQVWVSTALILLSSLTYSLGERAIRRSRHLSARSWLVATTVLGAAFISSQFIVWLELTNRGFYMQGNPYAGFFYILTAAHLVHVAGGIAALGSVLLRSWYPSRSEAESLRRRELARSVGWYWHFMGILWVVLFVMLGFWK